MGKRSALLFLIFAILFLGNSSQCLPDHPNPGDPSALDAYTLYILSGHKIEGNEKAVLIDMDGNSVHSWDYAGWPSKMLPGGSIFVCHEGRNKGMGVAQETLDLSQISWSGDLEWSYRNWGDDGSGTISARQHHDFQRDGNPVGYYAPGQEVVTNGNTLVLAHFNEIVPEISDKELLDDVIYEVDASGNLTGFEWHAAEHYQEFGFSSAAQASIYSNPSYDARVGYADWLHTNSMSRLGKNKWYDENGDERFNPQNIIMSSRQACFIIIIDYRTGSVVWRFGPDASSDPAFAEVGQLIGEHHAHMIPDGLPGAGNIIVFDNGGPSGYGPQGNHEYVRTYSRIVEFDPTTYQVVWEYKRPSGNDYFYSPSMGSVQRLPNGNTFITEADTGRLFEVNSAGTILWSWLPDQSACDPQNPCSIYRSYRIPPQWLPEGANSAGYADWPEN
jgi:hypothetical protein